MIKNALLLTILCLLSSYNLSGLAHDTKVQRIPINRNQNFKVKFTPDTETKQNIKKFKTYDFGLWTEYMAGKDLETIFEAQFNAIKQGEKTKTEKGSFYVVFKALSDVSLFKKAYFKDKGDYEIIEVDSIKVL